MIIPYQGLLIAAIILIVIGLLLVHAIPVTEPALATIGNIIFWIGIILLAIWLILLIVTLVRQA